MENGQSTTTKLGLPTLTPNQQEALQKVTQSVEQPVVVNPRASCGSLPPITAACVT